MLFMFVHRIFQDRYMDTLRSGICIYKHIYDKLVRVSYDFQRLSTDFEAFEIIWNLDSQFRRWITTSEWDFIWK